MEVPVFQTTPPVIGNFYNSVRNQFLSSSSFWHSSRLALSALTNVELGSSNIEVEVTSSFNEKAELFNVDASAKISVMGLANIKGSFSLLQTSTSTSKVVRAFGVMEFVDDYYEIPSETLNTPDFPGALDPVQNPEEPLHVITGVTYGSYVILDCAYELSENDNSESLSGSLSGVLKKLEIGVEVDFELTFDEEEQQLTERLDCQLTGDIVIGGNAPTTFEEFLTLFASAPKSRTSAPIRVTVKPADQIISADQGLLCAISDDIFNDVLETYDRVAELNQRAKDVKTTAENLPAPGILERIAPFERHANDIFSEFQTKIRSDVAEYKITCQGLDAGFAGTIENSLGPLFAWLTSIEAEVSFVETVVTSMTNYAIDANADILSLADESAVAIFRTAGLSDDEYLQRILRDESVTGIKPCTLFKRDASRLLDTLSMLKKYDFGGQLVYQVDPISPLFDTEVKRGVDLIGFRKETRKRSSDDHARRLFQIRSAFGPDLDLIGKPFESWFSAGDDGTFPFAKFDIIITYRDSPTLGSAYHGHVVDNLCTDLASCGGPEFIRNMSDWTTLEVFHASGTYTGHISNVRSKGANGEVLWSAGCFTEDCLQGSEADPAALPLVISRGGTVFRMDYELDATETWTGTLIVSSRDGWWPVLFRPFSSFEPRETPASCEESAAIDWRPDIKEFGPTTTKKNVTDDSSAPIYSVTFFVVIVHALCSNFFNM